MRRIAILTAGIVLAGCGGGPPASNRADMVREFVESSLALSPPAATSYGYHVHAGRQLDRSLDDWSEAGLEARLSHWRNWRQRLERIDVNGLPLEERADLDLMRQVTALALFDLETARLHETVPTLYVESLGNALFTPWTLEYAPAPDRWRHIVARLRATPAFLRAAQAQLTGSSPELARTAIAENQGTIAMVDKELRESAPAAIREEFASAAGPALAAMREFSVMLEQLPARRPVSWRLGKEKYKQAMALTLGEATTPEQLLADAEAELKATRRRMFDAALPLHKKYYPSHRDPVDLNLIVGEVLEKIAQKRPSREKYFAAAESMLAEARAFLAAHENEIAPLTSNDNLKIIPTPEFMRGVYSVGGFNPAPPLQPSLGAFYWLTPFGPNEPAASVESRLREYNDYGLRILTLHEAIPGHYLQAEYAARIQDPGRRALRSVFGNGVYIEGWAVYSNAMMLRAGYLKGDPELQMTFDKQMLRTLGNTILDIRMHAGEMTDDEALEFMRKQTFQEEQEARGKLLRAKLRAIQLTTYYAGYRDWMKLRADAEKRAGAGFSARDFHVKALQAGALPMPALRLILGL